MWRLLFIIQTPSLMLCAFGSSEFDKELEKTWQQHPLTQDVFISNEKPNTQTLRVPVTFSGTMHTIFHFCQQTPYGSISPLWRMRPLTISITPLLLRLPSICVTSKRPYQWCWCRSRKCIPLLLISQNLGSFIRKHLPTYTPFYWNNSTFWAAGCPSGFKVCHWQPFIETIRLLERSCPAYCHSYKHLEANLSSWSCIH